MLPPLGNLCLKAEMMKILKNDRNNGRINLSDKLRLKVLKSNGYRCTYCGIDGSQAELQIDHIIPVAKGGSNHPSNLTVACRSCNAKKSDSLKFAKPDERLIESITGSSLLNYWVHTWDDGAIEYQGKVITDLGSHCVIKLFSWLHGYDTGATTVLKKLEMMDSKRVFLYTTYEKWREIGDEYADGKIRK